MNKVYAIIGPPASGKTSIVKELGKYGIPEMISHTTRSPQLNEQHGKDYYFVSNEEFGQIQLIERVNYSGFFYGLSKAEVLEKIKKYPITTVAVDAQGLEQIKKLLGERVESIFIMVDKNTIIERVIARGDNPDSVKRRIAYAEAKGEFDNWQIADHVVKNTVSLDAAVRQILAIMGCSYPVNGSER